MRRRRSAVTLLELLIVMTMIVILTVALSAAFGGGIDFQRAQTRRQSAIDERRRVEARLRALVRGAFLSEDENSATTYFVGDNVDGGTDLGCDRLTFTTLAPGIPLAAQDSDDDFEALHDALGAVGGVAEVSLSTLAVGDPGEKAGLFERVQRPSDDDPTQGGRESLLGADIERIGFQFWDGAQWLAEWDTRATQGRRLPQAIQIQYQLRGAAEDDIRQLILPLPASDVDAENPVTTTGAAA